MPFKKYVKTVMRVEFPGWIARKRRGGTAYITAGAVAAKQYAWYWTTKKPRYKVNGKCFDVYDNVRDQVYKPAKTQSTAAEAITSAAVEKTWKRVIRRKKVGGGLAEVAAGICVFLSYHLSPADIDRGAGHPAKVGIFGQRGLSVKKEGLRRRSHPSP